MAHSLEPCFVSHNFPNLFKTLKTNYSPAGAYEDQCLDVPCGQRDECGTNVNNTADCVSRDCCWAPTGEPGAPWCFRKPGEDGIMSSIEKGSFYFINDIVDFTCTRVLYQK